MSEPVAPITPDALSLEQQAGQLIIAGFPGTAPGPEVQTLITDCAVGGVCLFLHNCIGGPDQVRALTSGLQAMARCAGLPPLLVAIDQEGGTVTRLRHPFAVFPSQMAQAATGDLSVAYRVARAMALEMRAVGVTWNFAPVLDVNNNASNPVIGVRSFGAHPAQVAEWGVAALKGYHDGGVLACGKHFPGHGDTHVDSHLDLPTIPFNWERLDTVELVPFRAAIAAGIPALMTAHIRFTAMDDLPATLSSRVLQGVLRERLAYTGLVVTDALNMSAIANTYSPAEATVLAVAAGADQCIALFSPAEVRSARDALVTAVRSGRIAPHRFHEAVGRVLRLKQQASRLPAPLPLTFPVADHQSLARQVAADSVTVLRDDGMLPLHTAEAGRIALIDFMLVRYSMVEEARQPALHLQECLTPRLPGLRSLVLDARPTAQESAAALALAASCDTLILVVRNAALIPEQAALIQTLTALGKSTIALAARLPYDAAVCQGARAVLATYGDPPCSLDAAVAVLLGDAPAHGRLPT